MRRDTRHNLFAGSFLILGVWGLAAGLNASQHATIEGPAYIVDGDSLRVGSRSIRLLGIDAPEYSQSCTDGSGKVYMCGLRARDRLSELIAGRHVQCHPRKEDIYHRTLSFCYVDGIDLSARMIASGMAVAFGDEGPKYSDLEYHARQGKLGLWSGSFDRPQHWRQTHAR